MQTDLHARRIEHAADQNTISDRISLVPVDQPAAEPLGRVVSVGGSQVIVQFSATAHESDGDVTVGTFLGIRNGRSLVVGALCDISLDQVSDRVPAVRRRSDASISLARS